MTDRLPESQEPVPVSIAEVSAPIPVVMAQSSEPMPVVIEQPKRQEPTIASVDREKLKSQGQRDINTKWETTQQIIALGAFFIAAIINSVVIILLLTSVTEVSAVEIAAVFAALSPINAMASLVIGNYFARTNHTAIGGVGTKDDDNLDYRGR